MRTDLEQPLNLRGLARWHAFVGNASKRCVSTIQQKGYDMKKAYFRVHIHIREEH